MKTPNLTKPFTHSPDIPVPVALAIYSIMHDIATKRDWSLLDSLSKDQALSWVESIAADNDLDVEKEYEWFKEQLKATDS